MLEGSSSTPPEGAPPGRDSAGDTLQNATTFGSGLLEDQEPWEWTEGIALLETPVASRPTIASNAGQAHGGRRSRWPGGRTIRSAAALLIVGAVATILVVGISAERNNGSATPSATAGSTSLALAASARAESPSAGSPLASGSSGATAFPSVVDAGTSPPATAPVLAPTPYSPDGGSPVLDLGFPGDAKGWPIGQQAGSTQLSLSAGGYVVTASGRSTDHLVDAPLDKGYRRLAVTATAAQSSGRGTAGFGVSCRSAGPVAVMYEFIVLNNGGWLVERRTGTNDVGAPTIVMHGTSFSVPGPKPIAISGICAASADGKTTRLSMFVDGVRLTDVADFTPTPSEGWRGGIVVSTVDVAATVVFASFEERDLD